MDVSHNRSRIRSSSPFSRQSPRTTASRSADATMAVIVVGVLLLLAADVYLSMW